MRPFARLTLSFHATILVAALLSEGPALARRYLVHDRAVTIEYDAVGKGPLLVLLPSMGRSGDDFTEVVPALVSYGYRVVRPQPRGVRRSRGPAGPLTLHHLGDDVTLVIKRERRGSAIIVGHAFGNFVARMIASDHPKLVRGIVVAAGASKVFPDNLKSVVAQMSDPALPATERLRLLRLAMFAPGHDPAGWLVGWYPEAKEVQRRAADATPINEWWRAGRVPILELQPADDPFKPVGARGELARELGDERVTAVVIPDSSHALFPEQPELVAREIARWARSLAQR